MESEYVPVCYGIRAVVRIVLKTILRFGLTRLGGGELPQRVMWDDDTHEG